MVEIAPDIWLHIAQFIPDDDIQRDLLGLNSIFFELSMKLRYETISITELKSKSIWILNRLSDPAVSWRVRRLIFRPYYRIQRPSAGANRQPSSLQRWTDRVAGYAQRHLRVPYLPWPTQPVVQTSIDRTVALLIGVLPNLTNVRDFQLDSWNLPATAVDLQPLLSTAWKTFGKQLQTLSLTGNLDSFRGFTATSPNLESIQELSLDFTNNLFNPNSFRDAALLMALLPFVNGLAPRLRVLNVASWTILDLSDFFAQLDQFPQLESFFLRAVFDKSFAANPDGLSRFLVDKTPSLAHVELKLRPSHTSFNPEGGTALAQWMSTAASDHPAMFANLKTLHLYPTSHHLGFDAVKRFAQRSSGTLTRLVVRDRYLFYPEVDELLMGIGEVSSIETLQICVHMLSLRLLDLLARRCPQLKNLRLFIGYVGRCGDDGEDISNPTLFRTDMQQKTWTDWKIYDLDIWLGGATLDGDLMHLLAQAIPSIRSFWRNGHTMTASGMLAGSNVVELL